MTNRHYSSTIDFNSVHVLAEMQGSSLVPLCDENSLAHHYSPKTDLDVGGQMIYDFSSFNYFKSHKVRRVEICAAYQNEKGQDFAFDVAYVTTQLRTKVPCIIHFHDERHINLRHYNYAPQVAVHMGYILTVPNRDDLVQRVLPPIPKTALKNHLVGRVAALATGMGRRKYKKPDFFSEVQGPITRRGFTFGLDPKKFGDEPIPDVDLPNSGFKRIESGIFSQEQVNDIVSYVLSHNLRHISKDFRFPPYEEKWNLNEQALSIDCI